MSILSHIQSFRHNNECYEHAIDLDNDSVYLFGPTGEKLLEYTSDTNVIELNEQGQRKQIGRIHLNKDHRWVYVEMLTGTEVVGRSINDCEGLLKDEVDISKRWLLNRTPSQPVSTD